MNTLSENQLYCNSDPLLKGSNENAAWSRGMRVCLIVTCSFLISAGCSDKGANNKDFDYINAHPVSMVMRPGETEQARLTRSSDDIDFSSSFKYGNDISQDVFQACVNPGSKCRVGTFTASNSAAQGKLDILSFESTGSVASWFNPIEEDESILPFSTFPVTTQAMPPVIRFASGGYPDPQDVLFDNHGAMGHSLAVTADGSIWAWGDNYAGQLGDDSDIPSAMPVQVQSAESFVAVAAGGLHSISISDDGSVWAWGDNSVGQLGDGSRGDSGIPVQVQNLTSVIAVAAGDEHSLALLEDGSVWAWGSNSYRQLGVSSMGLSSVPVQVQNLDNIVAIAAGGSHSLALRSDATVWAWGNNANGQLGDTTTTNSSRPKQVQNLGAIYSIAAGESFSLAVRSDGSAWSWGSNAYNQLGRESVETCEWNAGCSVIPGLVNGLDLVQDVAAGARFGVARKTDGSVWVWGDNEFGQIAGIPGLGTTIARPVAGLNNVISIAAGSAHAIAMSADEACAVDNGRTGGRLLAWGNNILGARGDGTAVNWLRPTPVLALGDDASCARVNGHRLIVYKAGTGDGTIQSDIPGLTCAGMICWQPVTEGVNVTLTATADENSEFSDWSWDCAASTQSISFNMVSARLCKVHFNRVASVNPPPSPSQCNDGIDNDDDGFTDLEDAGCSSQEDDSELNAPAGNVTLTINITGSGEVFDNDDNSFFCYSGSTTTCTQSYAANTSASLEGISFGVEDVALWTAGCDNGTGVLEACVVNMDRNRSVSITMQ